MDNLLLFFFGCVWHMVECYHQRRFVCFSILSLFFFLGGCSFRRSVLSCVHLLFFVFRRFWPLFRPFWFSFIEINIRGKRNLRLSMSFNMFFYLHQWSLNVFQTISHSIFVKYYIRTYDSIKGKPQVGNLQYFRICSASA